MAVLTDAQKQQIAAKYYQIFQKYQQDNDAAAYLEAKAAFEQSLGDDEKIYYESIAGFQGQEDPDKYWKRIEKLAGGGGDVGQLTTGPDGKPTTLGQQVTQQMSEFLNFLNQPVDLNSPYAQNILRGTAFNTMREAQLAGVRGGLSGAATERAVANAAMGLEAQRQDRLMQALGMGSGRDLGLQNVDLSRQAQAEQRYQFDVGQAYKQYQQNMQNQMAGAGLVGGIGGAVVGGLTGGPAGIMPGAQMGAGLAAGAAGAMYPSWSAPARL